MCRGVGENSEEEAEREERRSREAGWPWVKKKTAREKGKREKWEGTEGGEKEKGRQNAGPLGKEKGSASCDTFRCGAALSPGLQMLSFPYSLPSDTPCAKQHYFSALSLCL